jgi:formate dehydrogenase iron-sulfur subunit
MDKCTFCSGGPEANGSVAEFEKYGRNRLAEGKLPLCAEMCSTKALIGGDSEVISAIYAKRVSVRESNGRYPSKDIFGWSTAYGPTGSAMPAPTPTPANKIPGAKS